MRDSDNKIIGEFAEGEDYKLMTCDHKYGNSITHVNSKHKNKISTQWRHKSGITEKLTVHAVVVFSYKHAQKIQQEIKMDYSVVLV